MFIVNISLPSVNNLIYFMVGVINFSLEKMKLIERQINLKLTVGGGVLGKYFKINSNK